MFRVSTKRSTESRTMQHWGPTCQVKVEPFATFAWRPCGYRTAVWLRNGAASHTSCLSSPGLPRPGGPGFGGVTRRSTKGTAVRDSFCVRFLAPKRAGHETKRNRLFHLVVRGFVVQKVAAILVPHHRPVGCSKSCSWFILHREMREARNEMRDARSKQRDTGYEIRDARCEKQDTRCDMRGARCEMRNARSKK